MTEDNLLSTEELSGLNMNLKTPIPIIHSYFHVNNKEDIPDMAKPIRIYPVSL